MAVDKKKLFEELLKKKGIHAPKGAVLKKTDRTGPFKLSFAQRRIWFLQQFDPQSGAYNDPTALRLKGELDLPALKRTFNEIIRRHHVLQMVFPAVKGQPVMDYHHMVKDGAPIDIEIHRTSLENEPGNPGGDADTRVKQYVNRFSGQPFDLSKDLLLRVSLLQIEENHYALVVNIHHIVLDGWSKGIMLQELMDLYKAFSAGQPSPLKELPLQYPDYVSWLHEWMDGKTYQTRLDYWKTTLDSAAPVLEMPFDHPRPNMASGKGSLEPFRFSPQELERLNTLAREQNVTLFMLLISLYYAMLYRYSGQEDIIVGTPVAGRQRVELENMIGLFLNTVVLRLNVTGDTTFPQFLEQVRKTALDGFANQDMPFEKLVEELNPQRSLSVAPIFQVMFQLQNAPMPPAVISGLTITPIQIDTGFSQVDLSLTVWEEDGGLNCTFEYNEDLYKRSTIRRMTRHYKNLAAAVLDDHDRALSRLPMLAAGEQNQILVDWNQTQADFPHDKCIHHLFSQSVEQYPEELAVKFGDRQLNYRDLDRRARNLANALAASKIGPEVFTGICMENSLELITGVIAILKTGGAYIPMDPGNPAKRIAAIVNDAKPAVVVTRSRFKHLFEDYSGQLIFIDSIEEFDKLESPGDVEIKDTQPHNAACVIYTSGSTGEPKGIVMEHRNIVNLITSFVQSYRTRPGDRVLPLTSIASASFVGEILPVLTSGGAVVLADKVHFLQMDTLMNLLESGQITILSTVPSMIARMNARMNEGKWNPGKLRLLLSGGEALSAGDIDHIKKDVTIVNGYGLTETTICSTYTIVNDQEHPQTNGEETISVGKPIINTQIYILDKNQTLVPIGVPGEIYIGGIGVSRGYLNECDVDAGFFFTTDKHRPTAQTDTDGFVLEKRKEGTFINHQSSIINLFKTGDLGCWLEDGNVKFLGRIDTQVQIHGYRIELSEIENHMGLHPDILDVAVIDREFTPGDRRLVAYMVVEKGRTLSTNQMREWLAHRLPEYMIPAVFEELDSMPLTQNGKVDVDALPLPSGERPELEVDFKAPQTGAEKKIAAIWQEFLKLDKVGTNDNFFDLGGHSLLLTQVHSRLSEIFDTELTIVDLFRHPTIYSLAKSLDTPDDQGQQALKKVVERGEKQRQAMKGGFKNKSARRSRQKR